MWYIIFSNHILFRVENDVDPWDTDGLISGLQFNNYKYIIMCVILVQDDIKNRINKLKLSSLVIVIILVLSIFFYNKRK